MESNRKYFAHYRKLNSFADNWVYIGKKEVSSMIEAIAEAKKVAKRDDCAVAVSGDVPFDSNEDGSTVIVS